MIMRGSVWNLLGRKCLTEDERSVWDLLGESLNDERSVWDFLKERSFNEDEGVFRIF